MDLIPGYASRSAAQLWVPVRLWRSSGSLRPLPRRVQQLDSVVAGTDPREGTAAFDVSDARRGRDAAGRREASHPASARPAAARRHDGIAGRATRSSSSTQPMAIVASPWASRSSQHNRSHGISAAEGSRHWSGCSPRQRRRVLVSTSLRPRTCRARRRRASRRAQTGTAAMYARPTWRANSRRRATSSSGRWPSLGPAARRAGHRHP